MRVYVGDHGRLTIEAPDTLSFAKNYEEVGQFLKVFRDQSTTATWRRGRFLVDFTTIKTLRPAAALCLVAEFHRWRLLRRRRLQPVRLEHWDPVVRQQLYELGFFEILESNAPPAPQTLVGQIRVIRFKSGISNDGSLPKALRIELERVLEDKLKYPQALYDALIEAMANAVEHAYPDGGSSDILSRAVGRRWWLTGSVDLASQRLRVLFYDQGITIPKSLPRTQVGEKIRGWLREQGLGEIVNDDGKMIAAAMTYRRSVTREAHRGRGLDDIRRLAERGDSNYLRIISGHGYYEFDSKNGDRSSNRTTALPGTLIEWDLSLHDR